MRELSLFSGAGGGLLGSKLLGWTSVGYIEYEPYCQKVLRQRIADGILDAAPIFGDIRKFISEGYADAYQGMVDVVTGGFPCQPFSLAGKGFGEFDPRNMWPQTIEVIRRVRPKFAFLENVPGLLTHRYIERIFGDLAESGFDCRWDIIGASDVGADHERERIWIFAYPAAESRSEAVAETLPTGAQRGAWNGSMRGVGGKISIPSWSVYPPELVREIHGVAGRLDRAKSIGNGQVPLCMAYAFQRLSEGIIE